MICSVGRAKVNKEHIAVFSKKARMDPAYGLMGYHEVNTAFHLAYCKRELVGAYLDAVVKTSAVKASLFLDRTVT